MTHILSILRPDSLGQRARGTRRQAMFTLVSALLLSLITSWGWGATGPDLLSPEERRWVEAHNSEFILAPTPDSPPVEFFDSQGRHLGIAADVMRRIGERLGIRFKLVRFRTWDEIVEAGRQHKIDLTSFAQRTPRREAFWNFTTPYLDASAVLISRKQISGGLNLNDLGNYKTGIVNAYALSETLARDRPGLRLIPMPDDLSGLTALETGELDVMISDLPTASYLIQRESMTGLHVAGDTGYQYHYSIASRSDWPELGRILQKGLDSITARERAEIYHQWVTLDDQGSRYWKHFTQVLTALLAVLGLGLLWMRALRGREARRRAEMARLLEEQRRTEEALRTLTGDLERRVSARTAELERTNASLHEEIRRHEQTQAQLRDREARFKAIMEQSTIAMMLFDPEGTLIDANEAWARMWQADRAAFIGRYNILRDPNKTLVQESVARALQGEAVDIAEHYCEPARWELPGPGCWLTGKAYPLRTPEGRVSSIILILEDITARIEARRTLAESENRFRAFFDLAPCSCTINDPEGRFVLVNNAFLEHNGLSAEAVLGRRQTEIGVKAENVDPAKIMEALQQQGNLMNYEVTLTNPAGARRHLLCSSRQIELGGKPLIISTSLDITERKQQEELLRQRERQLKAQREAVLNLMMDGSLFQDDFPDALRKITEIGSGLLGVERVGVWRYESDFADLCCLDVYTRGPGCHESGQRLASTHFGSYTACHKKGQVVAAADVFSDPRTSEIPAGYYQEHAIRSLLDAPIWIAGRIGGVLSFEAVGKQRPWSDEDERVAITLATLVSLCIENADRKRAERALREADRRKDEFLAMLAHELRNPLAPIRNASFVLHMLLPENERVQHQREIIDRQLAHMARLVDDLLDVSRITRGMIPLRRERVDLRALADQALDNCRPFISQRESDLVFTRPAQSIWLDADPLRMLQVIGNLLKNAFKFSEPGQRVWLELGTQAVNGAAEAFIRVRDAGAGIAPELLPHIFELFVQADKSLDRTKGGLGIGLTLVQRIAQLHGGRIDASSPGPGRGSEFTLWLPIPPELVPASNAPSAVGDSVQA